MSMWLLASLIWCCFTYPAMWDTRKMPVDNTPSPEIEKRLKQSDDVLIWVHSKLDGIRLPELPHDKRTQLGSACFHVSIEHSQAIVILMHERLYGSVIAFIRPLFEAFVRGLWLMQAATGEDIDRAGQDVFPGFGKLVADLEQPLGENFDGPLSQIKTHRWRELCSYTHTGFRQIGARLTADGLGYGYKDSQLHDALLWADSVAIMSTMSFAYLAKNEILSDEAQERLNRIPLGAG